MNTERSAYKSRTPGAGLLGPLNPPGYLTWLAVTLSPLLDWSDDTTLTARLALGLAAQILFMPLFAWRALLEERTDSLKRLRLSIIAQAAAVLVAVYGLQDKMQGVLLVLVAAQTPLIANVRWSAAVLGVANAAMLILFMGMFAPLKAIQLEISHVAFQLFAALVAGYAYRAHEARESVVRINAELLATRELLQEGTRTEERLRLSRELHDVIGHKLTALKLQLALLSRGVDVTETAVQRCARLTDDLLVDVRGVVTSLRESDGVDLHQALRALDPGLPKPIVDFELDEHALVPNIRHAEAILRCAQEGLTNALRHSGAERVLVALRDSVEGLTLSVEDDGKGPDGDWELGNGLRGLRERLQQLGGRVDIEARRPQGIVLRAILPHDVVNV